MLLNISDVSSRLQLKRASSDMKRRLKLTMTKVRRQTVVSTQTQQFCSACGSVAETLSPEEAAEALNVSVLRLCELLAIGEIHIEPVADGTLAVCKRQAF